MPTAQHRACAASVEGLRAKRPLQCPAAGWTRLGWCSVGAPGHTMGKGATAAGTRAGTTTPGATTAGTAGTDAGRATTAAAAAKPPGRPASPAGRPGSRAAAAGGANVGAEMTSGRAAATRRLPCASFCCFSGTAWTAKLWRRACVCRTSRACTSCACCCTIAAAACTWWCVCGAGEEQRSACRRGAGAYAAVPRA